MHSTCKSNASSVPSPRRLITLPSTPTMATDDDFFDDGWDDDGLDGLDDSISKSAPLPTDAASGDLDPSPAPDLRDDGGGAEDGFGWGDDNLGLSFGEADEDGTALAAGALPSKQPQPQQTWGGPPLHPQTTMMPPAQHMQRPHQAMPPAHHLQHLPPAQNLQHLPPPQQQHMSPHHQYQARTTPPPGNKTAARILGFGAGILSAVSALAEPDEVEGGEGGTRENVVYGAITRQEEEVGSGDVSSIWQEGQHEMDTRTEMTVGTEAAMGTDAVVDAEEGSERGSGVDGWGDEDDLSFGSDDGAGAGAGAPEGADVGDGRVPSPSAGAVGGVPRPPPFPTLATAKVWGAALAQAVAPPPPRGQGQMQHAPPKLPPAQPQPTAHEPLPIAEKPQAHPLPQQGSEERAAPGPFLGRLTRFIEDNAAPSALQKREDEYQAVPVLGEDPRTVQHEQHRQDGTAHALDKIDSTQDGSGWGSEDDEFDFEDEDDISANAVHDKEPAQPALACETTSLPMGGFGTTPAIEGAPGDVPDAETAIAICANAGVGADVHAELGDGWDEDKNLGLSNELEDVDATVDVNLHNLSSPGSLYKEPTSESSPSIAKKIVDQQRFWDREEGSFDGIQSRDGEGTNAIAAGFVSSETPSAMTADQRDKERIAQSNQIDSSPAVDYIQYVGNVPVCSVSCIAAHSGEVCPCTEAILAGNGGTQLPESLADKALSPEELIKLLQSEILRRTLLEKKSEADEHAISSLLEKSEHLYRQVQALEEEKDGDKADRRVAESSQLSDEVKAQLINGEKKVWEERTTMLEEEVRFLRDQVTVADMSMGQSETLSAELASLTYEFDCKVTECEELREKLEGTTSKFTEIENKLKQQTVAATKRDQDLGEEIANLRAKLDVLEIATERASEKEAQNDDVDRLSGLVDSLRFQLEERKNLHDQAIKTVKDYEEDLRVTEETILSMTRAHEKSVHALREEITAQSEKFEELRSECESLRSTLKAMEDVQTESNDQLQIANDINSSLERERDLLVDKFESTTKEHLEKLNQNLERLSQLEEANKFLQNEKNQLEMDVVNLSTAQDALDSKNIELESLKAEITSLNDQIKRSNITLEILGEERRDLLTQLEQQSHQFEGLEEQLREAMRDSGGRSPKGEELKASKAEEDDLASMCQELQETVARMNAESARTAAEISALKIEAKDALAQRDDLHAKISELQDEPQATLTPFSSFDTSRASTENHDELVTSLKDQVIALSSEKAGLQSQYDAAKEEATSCEELIQQLQKDVESLIQASNQLSGDKTAITKENSVLEERIQQLERAKGQSTKESEQQDVVIKSLKEKLVRFQSIADADLKERNAKISEMEIVAEKLQNVVSEAITEKNDALSRLKLLDHQNELLQLDLNECEEELAILRDAAVTRDKVIAEKNRTETELLAEIAGLRREASESSILSPKNQEKMASLQKEILDIKACLDKSRNDLATAVEERETLNAENEELFIQLGLYEDERKNYELKVGDLVDQATIMEGDSNETSTILRYNGEEMESMRIQINQLTALCSDRATELADRDATIHKFQSRLNTVVSPGRGEHSDREELECQVVELEKQLAETECELSRLSEAVAAQQQNAMNANDSAGDKHVDEQTIMSLQLDLAVKEDEVNGAEERMKNMLASHTEQMRVLNEDLAAKEDEILKHKSELVSMRAEMETFESDIAGKQDVIARLSGVPQDLSTILSEMSSQDKAESVEFMRRQIITLATAVEGAEIGRAEALDRIVHERHMNAASLRKLGESVKRFYSAISCSD